MWWVLGENSMLTTYETKSASTKVDAHNKSTNMKRTWHRLALTKSFTFTTIFNKCEENMTRTFDKKIDAQNTILANARRTQHVLSIKFLTLTIDRQNLFEFAQCLWFVPNQYLIMASNSPLSPLHHAVSLTSY
jgi:hypothetical protein